MLLGNKSDPGRQASPGRELFPITHFSDQGGGDDRTNARDLLEPPAFFARAMPGMDVLLEHSDLCRDYGVLAGKNIETEPRGCRKPTVLLVSNDLEQLGCAVAPLRRDNAELGPYAHGSRLTASFADGREAVGCDAASSLIAAVQIWSARNASTAASQPRRLRRRHLHRSCCASDRPSHNSAASLVPCGRAPEADGSNDVRSGRLQCQRHWTAKSRRTPKPWHGSHACGSQPRLQHPRREPGIPTSQYRDQSC